MEVVPTIAVDDVPAPLDIPGRQLIEAFIGTDGNRARRAWLEIYSQYESAIFRIAKRTGLPDWEAADVLQEVASKLFGARETFNGRSGAELAAWIRRVAFNESITNIRVRRKVDLSDQADTFETPSGESPERTAVLRRAIRACLERLNEAERQAINAVYGQGLTQVAAAPILGIPRETLRNHLRTGKEKLARCMAVKR